MSGRKFLKNIAYAWQHSMRKGFIWVSGILIIKMIMRRRLIGIICTSSIEGREGKKGGWYLGGKLN